MSSERSRQHGWGKRAVWVLWLSAGLAGIAACSDGDTEVDPDGDAATSVDDAGSHSANDAGARDATTDATVVVDAGVDAADETGDADAHDAAASTITEILGTLTGVCPALQGALAQTAPAHAQNEVDFVSGEVYERAALSSGGQRLYDTPNAGGSSSASEVLAYEVLHYCEGASLHKTETEVDYATAGKMTDLVVDIGARRLGVSVVRAVGFPCGSTLSDDAARSLIRGKLADILQSSANVAVADRWERQILHVVSANPANTEAVLRALPSIEPAVRADTLVMVTETRGGAFLYYDASTPPGNDCPLP